MNFDVPLSLKKVIALEAIALWEARPKDTLTDDEFVERVLNNHPEMIRNHQSRLIAIGLLYCVQWVLDRRDEPFASESTMLEIKAMMAELQDLLGSEDEQIPIGDLITAAKQLRQNQPQA